MKPIEELTFTDDFMFGWVMLNCKDLARRILECILGIKVGRIRYRASQKTVKRFATCKGVRFDFYAENSKRIIEVEMQVQNEPDILLRSRYYFSAIDTSTLKTSKDYRLLKETYVVFICLTDPLGKGESTYTVQRVCKESATVNVDNGTHEMYLNASAWEKESDVALKALLRYIYTRETTDAMTKELDHEVEEQKAREEFRDMYIEIGSPVDVARKEGLAMGRQEGMAKGRQEGMAKKAASAARAMLAERLPIATIVRCTGLTQGEVLSLQQDSAED